VTEKKRSFWDRLFGTNNRSGRQDKVLEYVIHRIEDGANLREVLQEEYVRRNATTEEVQSILENPRLIEAAGEQLREDFSSGKLDPRQKRPYLRIRSLISSRVSEKTLAFGSSVNRGNPSSCAVTRRSPTSGAPPLTLGLPRLHTRSSSRRR
jgi:hypothetical protein